MARTRRKRAPAATEEATAAAVATALPATSNGSPGQPSAIAETSPTADAAPTPGPAIAATPNPATMPLRLEWRTPAELADNPANWRRHPEKQIAALTDVIAEVGWAGASLYNERTKRLIDGHARKAIALKQGASLVPVLVGNWSEEQERKILATLDPLSGMAEADPEKVAALILNMETESAAVQALLDSLADGKSDAGAGEGGDADQPAGEDVVTERYQILIDFKNETEQAAWLAKLTKEGLNCRSLMS